MSKTTVVILFLSVSLLILFSSCNKSKVDTAPSDIAAYTKDTAAVHALIKKANSFTQTNFDSMRYYAKKAFDIASQIKYGEGRARARGIEGNYQRRKGNYAESIAICLEVIKSFDSLNLVKRRIVIQSFLSDTYKEMGGEKGTAEYLKKGLELAKQTEKDAEDNNFPDEVVAALNQQGIILRDMSKHFGPASLMDSALLLYEKGVRIIQQSGQGEDQLGKLYNNISQVYNEYRKDYSRALDYLFRAVAFNKERNNFMSLSYNYGNISDVYTSLNDMAKAKSFAHAMLYVSEELKAPHRKVNAYRNLTRVSRKLKEFDSALYYNELAVDISDSLNNVEKAAQIADMQVKYETDKVTSRNNELVVTNKLRNQQLWFAGIAASIMLLLVVISVIQNRRLRLQKKQIAQQSDRLQWMMKELHHRVKNNLQIVSSLLNLQSYRLKDEESVAAIKESQLRVQAMSLMHQRLYQVDDVSMVNFKLYLTDLAETLMRAYGYGADDFDLAIDVEQEFLDVDTVMPMGLLVNEIITNSFKYAYKDVARPALRIHLASADKQLKLEVGDNGPGMVDTASKAGFGKKLIAALTQQLKAKYTVDTTNGTLYTFNIPYTKEKAA
ncbi:MAG TPA: sensor histidine kinase [Chitinophagaceae bacterium]|nr:sensor histidine kinase [Chitinophagaceae bacterium]